MAKKLENSASQTRAKTAAKTARIKEAGLDSRRVGRVSASVKKTQAKRDAKN